MSGVICLLLAQLIISTYILHEEIKEKTNEITERLNEDRKILEKEIANKRTKLERTEYELIQSFNNKSKTLEKKEEELIRSFNNKAKTLDKKEEEVITLLNSKAPFRKVAQMITDVKLKIFDESYSHLRTKRNPAYSAAEEIKEMKKIAKGIMTDYKEMQYKFDYLLTSFPGIKEIIDDDEDLIGECELIQNEKTLKENYDKVRDFLSPEEYDKLSSAEKNQLALDRYLKRKKSKAEIGREYELSCAWQLQMEGYSVELHGIKYLKADLGRDLIARKSIGGLWSDEILIIQCKNWSHRTYIRENVVMQLFGTYMEYELDLKAKGQLKTHDIKPVLMIPEYSRLSEEAKHFAKRLNIRIDVRPNKDYPRIKCNINNGNKIYHLPFDQQYDRTEIKLKGECYCTTVLEAERLGFRRAKRHFISSNQSGEG